MRVDFDGVADGRAIRNCLSNVKPRKLILVHGTEKTTKDLKLFVESSIPMCEAVFTPNVMECIDIESDTNVYKLSVKESLYTAAVFRKVCITLADWYDVSLVINMYDYRLAFMKSLTSLDN